jgi:hypothetical protein
MIYFIFHIVLHGCGWQFVVDVSTIEHQTLPTLARIKFIQKYTVIHLAKQLLRIPIAEYACGA